METILSKLYSQNKNSAVQDILKNYHQNKSTIVHFLYFAPIVSQQLFETSFDDRKKILYREKFSEKRKLLHGKSLNATMADYEKSLIDSDFVLPDGIALQLYYFVARLTRKIRFDAEEKKLPFFLKNLNGTDFTPFFLDELKRQYGPNKIGLILYGASPEVSEKTKKYFSSKGFSVVFNQDGYSPLDRKELEESLSEYENTINILLIARSTPEIPVQELRTYYEKENIEKYNLLTITGGGFFEYFTGEQKRAPKIVRTVKLEWLWRVITDPQRNKNKVRQSLQVFSYIFSQLLLKKK